MHTAETLLRVQVEVIGVPMLEEALGSRRLEMETGDPSLRALIDALVRLSGDPVRKALFDESGSFDTSIQIVVNGERFVRPEEPGVALRDGDKVIFMMLIGGG